MTLYGVLAGLGEPDVAAFDLGHPKEIIHRPGPVIVIEHADSHATRSLDSESRSEMRQFTACYWDGPPGRRRSAPEGPARSDLFNLRQGVDVD